MRFTIRDLLWLMMVVALAAAWWVDRRQSAARLAETKAELQRTVEGQQATFLRWIKAWNKDPTLTLDGAADSSAVGQNLPRE